jgi:hypothetical protein
MEASFLAVCHFIRNAGKGSAADLAAGKTAPPAK